MKYPIADLKPFASKTWYYNIHTRYQVPEMDLKHRPLPEGKEIRVCVDFSFRNL